MYLAQDITNLQRQDESMQQLRNEQRKPLKLVNNGALGFILDQWRDPTEHKDAVIE